MGKLQKIVLKSKGDFNVSNTYYELDYVRYSSCTWVAKRTVTGVYPPTDPTATSNDWALLSMDGTYAGQQYPSWNNITTKPYETLGSDFDVSNGELSVIFPDNTWSATENKPFKTLNEDNFEVNNDELSVKYPDNTWSATDNKPFETLNDDNFEVDADGELTVKHPDNTWTNTDGKPFSTLNEDNFVVEGDELSVLYPENTWAATNNKPFNTVGKSFSTAGNELNINVDGRTIFKDSNGTLYADAGTMSFNIDGLAEENGVADDDCFPFFDASTVKQRKTKWSNIKTLLASIFSKITKSDGTLIANTKVFDDISGISSNTEANNVAGALAVKDIYLNSAPKPTSAPVHDSAKAYSKGDVVSYGNVVYYANRSIAKNTAWNAAYWTVWSTNMPIKFGVDADGNYGYYKAGADSVTPFKKGGTLVRETLGSISTTTTFKIKELFPDLNFDNITADNFCAFQTAAASAASSSAATGSFNVKRISSITASSSGTASMSNPSLTYVQSTGILTVTPTYIVSSTRVACSGAATEGKSYESSGSSGASYSTFTVYFYHTA